MYNILDVFVEAVFLVVVGYTFLCACYSAKIFRSFSEFADINHQLLVVSNSVLVYGLKFYFFKSMKERYISIEWRSHYKLVFYCFSFSIMLQRHDF